MKKIIVSTGAGISAESGIKTFSKHELEELIQSAGFNNYRFYYPYPDYLNSMR